MSWRAEYLVLIIISTLIDYIVGILLYKSKKPILRKLYLTISIAMNLGLLFIFKYYNFFNNSAKYIATSFNLAYPLHSLDVLLPVGISFYTFQTMSYTIDVYRNSRKPENNLGIFALYVSFFPQLVAGPIERSTHLIPQFYEKIKFNQKRIISGLRLMLWGFFQKIVIADRLAIIVDQVYNKPHNYSGITFIIATYFFAFQILCDFSGYTDIARGAARVLGFNLMLNFRQPYLAQSIGEFWKRWHISLTTWFRDYVYVPLGGNRVNKKRWCINVAIIFLVSGLWHGANWTFVIWGLLHFIYYFFGWYFKGLRTKLYNIIQPLKLNNNIFIIIKTFITFHLVCFSWIFFRANNISDALYIIKNIFKNTVYYDLYQIKHLYSNIVFSIIVIIFLYIVHIYQNNNSINIFLKLPLYARWIVYIILTLIILNIGVYKNIPFIYFQF